MSTVEEQSAPPTTEKVTHDGKLLLKVQEKWEPMFCRVLAPGHFAAYQDAESPENQQLACVLDLADAKCEPQSDQPYTFTLVLGRDGDVVELVLKAEDAETAEKWIKEINAMRRSDKGSEQQEQGDKAAVEKDVAKEQAEQPAVSVEQLNQADKPVDAVDVVLKTGEAAIDSSKGEAETPYFTPREDLQTVDRATFKEKPDNRPVPAPKGCCTIS